MLNRFEKFTGIVSDIHRHLIKISSDQMKKYGLHGTSARILLAFRRNGSMTAAELTKFLGKNKAEVSRTVADLEEKALIQKTYSSVNYRVRLQLTDAGKAVSDDLSKTLDDVVYFVGQGVTDEEREILYHALESISNNLASISKKGIDHCEPLDWSLK